MAVKVFDNYKVKLVAFILAIFIWFFVVTENDYEHVIQIPISAVNLPPEKIILNDLPENVKVKVRGTGKDLIALMLRRGAALNLDLSDIEHSRTFRVEPSSVFLSRPTGPIETLEIVSPDSISVIVDNLQNKKVPILSKIELQVAPGYTQVGGVQIMPDSILISGPKTILTEIQSVATEVKKYENLTDDLKETIALEQPESQKVNYLTNLTEVSIDIQKLVEISFSGVPVNVRNAPANMTVYPRPSRLNLVLEGGGELLARITKDDIIAYIDYNRAQEAPGIEHKAVIETPKGIRIRNVEPQKFKLVFETIN